MCLEAQRRASVRGRFHEDTKERKGLGTSPFGPPGLTTVPIPCVSADFLEASMPCRETQISQIQADFGVLAHAGQGALTRPRE